MFEQALVRDDYRCLVTGGIDEDSFLAGLADQRSPDEMSMVTRCSHIFPEPLGRVPLGGSGTVAEVSREMPSGLCKLPTNTADRFSGT